MGKFNLEGRSNVMGGASILGVDERMFGFWASPYILDQNQSAPYMSNKNVARIVVEKAYDPTGNPLRGFSSKRSFRGEDYQLWSSFREVREIEIAGFNFPLEIGKDFLSLNGLVERLKQGNVGGIRKKLGEELERRIYLPEQFRYGCKGQSVLYFHEEDAMKVAQDVLGIGENNRQKEGYVWYTLSEVESMITNGGACAKVSPSRIQTLMEKLGTKGIHIDIDVSSRPKRVLLNNEMINALKEANRKSNPKKRRKLWVNKI